MKRSAFLYGPVAALFVALGALSITGAVRAATTPAPRGVPQDAAIARTESRISVKRHGLVAFPLYDGTIQLVGSGLHDLGPALLRAPRAASVGPYVARSKRAELFRAVGKAGERGLVTVLLRLSNMPEHCASCRTVHYFYTIR